MQEGLHRRLCRKYRRSGCAILTGLLFQSVENLQTKINLESESLLSNAQNQLTEMMATKTRKPPCMRSLKGMRNY